MTENTTTDEPTPKELADWTIMVYMAGDNNLSENMAVSLADVGDFRRSLQTQPDFSQPDQSAQPKANPINLMVFFDGNSLTAPTQYIDFTEPVENPVGKTKYPPVEAKNHVFYTSEDTRDDDGNSASATSIMNFVHWCVQTKERKAKNYAIIFSGHSFGFHGTSFLRDESSGGFITLHDFRKALERIVDETLDNKKFAILGFDSCVMSMLEVGCELKEVAQTIVASEGSLPNSGWSYTHILKAFMPDIKKTTTNKFTGVLNLKNKSALRKFLTPYIGGANLESSLTISEEDIPQVMQKIIATPKYIEDAAKGFVDEFINHHSNLLVGGRSVDIAAWNLNEVDNVVESLNNLAVKFNELFNLYDKIQSGNISDNDIAIYQDLKKIILLSHYDTQTYMQEQCIDLKDFCKQLIIQFKFVEKGENTAVFTELIKLCKNVIESINKFVLKSGFSGDEYQFSNGVSLYFPWSHVTFELTNLRYRSLLFSRGQKNKKDLDKLENFEGAGKDWYIFLLNYLFRVSLRLARKRNEDGADKFSAFEDFSQGNQIWSKPIWSKDNPIWSKSNPDSSRSNPPSSRSNPDSSRSNPDSSRSNPPSSRSNPDSSRSNPPSSRSNPDSSKGEIGNYLFYFSRFKNFENRWDISDFADTYKSETDFDESIAEGTHP
jgi:Clostripain family